MKFFLAAFGVAIALASSLSHADEAVVRNMLQQSFPQRTIKSIVKTPVSGVLEAVVDGRVFYVSQDGRYVFAGPLIDARTNENLTQARLDQINAIPFASLPLADAIKRVKGNGSRKIAVFEDPDCPYCKKLEQEISSIDNLTTYVFLYPIEQLHPDAPGKSKAIWCAADRGKAWKKAVLTGAVPAGPANCSNPVERNVAFGRAHGINGTPTTIFANGFRLAGAVPGDELERQLAKAAKNGTGVD